MTKSNTSLVSAFFASLVLSVAWSGYESQQFRHYLVSSSLVFTALCLSVLAYQITYRFFRKKSLVSRPVASSRWRWVSLVSWSLFSVTLSYAAYLSVPKIQYAESDFWIWTSLRWVSLPLIWLTHGLVRSRPFHASLYLALFLCSSVLGYEVYKVYRDPPLEESVVLGSFTKDPVYIFAGGASRLNNPHMSHTPTRYLCALMVSDQSFAEDGETSPEERSRRSFGKKVYAPTDGVIYELEKDLPDNPIGQPNMAHPLGNHVIIELGPKRFLMISNFKQDTLRVDKGDQVKAGDYLGQIGFSAVLSECVLMTCVVDRPDLFHPSTVSTPFYFKEVVRKGDKNSQKTVFPVSNDILIPNVSKSAR